MASKNDNRLVLFLGSAEAAMISFHPRMNTPLVAEYPPFFIAVF